jgi:hypothetical protein
MQQSLSVTFVSVRIIIITDDVARLAGGQHRRRSRRSPGTRAIRIPVSARPRQRREPQPCVSSRYARPHDGMVLDQCRAF